MFDIINTYEGLLRLKDDISILSVSPAEFDDEDEVRYYIMIKDGSVIIVNDNLICKEVSDSSRNTITYKVSLPKELNYIVAYCINNKERIE